MDLLLLFLAGALFCNSEPHLASGLRGDSFPTPFARPRGVGQSSPLVNFLWGAANLFGGIALSGRIFAVEVPWGYVAMVAGFLVMGTYLALHFGRVRNKGRR